MMKEKILFMAEDTISDSFCTREGHVILVVVIFFLKMATIRLLNGLKVQY